MLQPILSIDWWLPMERTEKLDAIERVDPTLRMLKALKTDRRDNLKLSG